MKPLAKSMRAMTGWIIDGGSHNPIKSLLFWSYGACVSLLWFFVWDVSIGWSLAVGLLFGSCYDIAVFIRKVHNALLFNDAVRHMDSSMVLGRAGSGTIHQTEEAFLLVTNAPVSWSDNSILFGLALAMKESNWLSTNEFMTFDWALTHVVVDLCDCKDRTRRVFLIDHPRKYKGGKCPQRVIKRNHFNRKQYDKLIEIHDLQYRMLML